MEREQSYRDAKVKKEEAAYLEKLEKQTELQKRIDHRKELEKLIDERAQQEIVAKQPVTNTTLR